MMEEGKHGNYKDDLSSYSKTEDSDTDQEIEKLIEKKKNARRVAQNFQDVNTRVAVTQLRKTAKKME